MLSVAHPTIARWHAAVPPRLQPHLGRLLTPRDNAGVDRTIALGVPVAADNRAFVGFDPTEYRAMLNRIAHRPVLYAVAPDVVADAAATDHLWRQWAPEIAGHGIPPAYVAQDGCQDIPTDAGAVFIGGTDHFKLGPRGAQVVADAKARGLHVHVGRVNTQRRVTYCHALGANSFDGTGWSRWQDRYVVTGLELAAGHAPQPLIPLARV